MLFTKPGLEACIASAGLEKGAFRGRARGIRASLILCPILDLRPCLSQLSISGMTFEKPLSQKASKRFPVYATRFLCYCKTCFKTKYDWWYQIVSDEKYNKQKNATGHEVWSSSVV